MPTVYRRISTDPNDVPAIAVFQDESRQLVISYSEAEQLAHDLLQAVKERATLLKFGLNAV